jgi:uncharacterized protein (DUF58 family)
MVEQPALTPERLLRRLEWQVIRRLDGRLQGDYRTLFRGTGIDVVDLREYQPGDDLRHIDWNVTARTDVPHVREYVEDREVTAWLVLDRSASMDFGPADRRKQVVVAEVAATVAQLLARGGNRVGAILFDAAVEEVIPPGSGRSQVLRILSRLMAAPKPAAASKPAAAPKPAAPAEAGGRRGRLRRNRPGPSGGSAEPPRTPTDLAVPLRAALGVLRRRSLVVIVSDFISEPGWERPLGLLAQRHDVVAVQVFDRHEHDLPSVGLIYLQDPETGEQIFVDTDDAAFTGRLRELAQARQSELVAGARSAGTDLFTVSTDEDLVRALARIAELRRRRRR